MEPDQGRLAGRGKAAGADQCEVLRPGAQVAVAVQRENAMGGRQRCRGDQLDAVVQVAPGDQLRDGDDRQVLALAQSEDVGRPQYFTGVVDDFADRTDRWQPRQPAQVDGCLGVSDALEDSPALARSGSTWPGRIRSDASASGLPRTRSVVARSAAEIPVVTPAAASTLTVYAVRSGSALFGTIRGSPRRSAHWFGIGAQR